MGSDEIGTREALRVHREELIDPKIVEYGGRIVKTMGDGLLLEFPSVVNATRCVIEVQQHMAERNEAVEEDQRIAFRVGVNLGDVIIEGDDIHGDGVNIAARLQEIAEPGGVAISRRVHEDVQDRLDTLFDDAGEQTLKNIARPIHVWRWSSMARPAGSSSQPDSEPLALPDKPSIAVLPFDNMSQDPEQEYFADGMTEDIITGLSKYHSFFVIARNTSFTFKCRSVDVKETAQKLGVRYVLEGSVRKAGTRVRVTVQLIDGMTGNHVWTERYDRQLEDIFDVQDEMTESIVGKLGPEIGSIERKRVAGRQPDNLDAWGLMQQGLHFLWRMDSEGLATSIRLLNAALDKAPDLAQAHSYLSFALEQLALLGLDEGETDLVKEAYHHARTAIDLDADDSLSHIVLARFYTNERRYDDAIHEAKIAVDLNPNHGLAYHTLAITYIWANRRAEGLKAIDQAIRLSPNDPWMPLFLTCKAIIAEVTDGNFVKSLEYVRKASRMPNADYRVWIILCSLCAGAGLMDEARRAAAKVLEKRPDFSAKLFREWYRGFHPDFADLLEQRFRLAGLN